MGQKTRLKIYRYGRTFCQLNIYERACKSMCVYDSRSFVERLSQLRNAAIKSLLGGGGGGGGGGRKVSNLLHLKV